MTPPHPPTKNVLLFIACQLHGNWCVGFFFGILKTPLANYLSTLDSRLESVKLFVLQNPKSNLSSFEFPSSLFRLAAGKTRATPQHSEPGRPGRLPPPPANEWSCETGEGSANCQQLGGSGARSTCTAPARRPQRQKDRKIGNWRPRTAGEADSWSLPNVTTMGSLYSGHFEVETRGPAASANTPKGSLEVEVGPVSRRVSRVVPRREGSSARRPFGCGTKEKEGDLLCESLGALGLFDTPGLRPVVRGGSLARTSLVSRSAGCWSAAGRQPRPTATAVTAVERQRPGEASGEGGGQPARRTGVVARRQAVQSAKGERRKIELKIWIGGSGPGPILGRCSFVASHDRDANDAAQWPSRSQRSQREPKGRRQSLNVSLPVPARPKPLALQCALMHPENKSGTWCSFDGSDPGDERRARNGKER